MATHATYALLRRDSDGVRVVSDANKGTSGGLSQGTWITIIVMAAFGLFLLACSLYFVRRFFRGRFAERWADEEARAPRRSSIHRGPTTFSATDIEAWRHQGTPSATDDRTMADRTSKRISSQSEAGAKESAWRRSQPVSVRSPAPVDSDGGSSVAFSPPLPTLSKLPTVEAVERQPKRASTGGKSRKAPPASPTYKAEDLADFTASSGSSISGGGTSFYANGGSAAAGTQHSHVGSTGSRSAIRTPAPPQPVARGWPALLIQAGARPLEGSTTPPKRSSRMARSNQSH
ncbi:hypothetical protein ACQY0O_002559 [Thecaphora frezii]